MSIYRIAASLRLHATPAVVGVAAALAAVSTGNAQDRATAEPAPAPTTYTVLPAASVLAVHTYKAGLLGGLGHEHDIRAEAFTGSVA